MIIVLGDFIWMFDRNGHRVHPDILKKELELMGHRVWNTPSPLVDLYVDDNPAKPTARRLKAKESFVRTVTTAELLELVGYKGRKEK